MGQDKIKANEMREMFTVKNRQENSGSLSFKTLAKDGFEAQLKNHDNKNSLQIIAPSCKLYLKS